MGNSSDDNNSWVRWLSILAAIATIVSCLVLLVPQISKSSSNNSPQGGDQGNPLATVTATNTSTSSTAIPTATSVPPGRFPYRANWAQGPDGWPVSGPWKILNESLINDGTGDAGYILAPFNP